MAFLNDHFARVQRSLLDKGEEARLAEHPTLIGMARELIVSEFLKAALPNNTSFINGEIIDSLGGRSGQVDVIIVPAFAPRFILGGDSGIALADGVIGTLEVKSSIAASSPDTDSQLTKAMATVRKIKERHVSCTPWPWVANKGAIEVKLTSIPSSIVAFRGPEQVSLQSALQSFADRFGTESLPNTVSVIDKGYTLVRDDDWYFTKLGPLSTAKLYVAKDDTGACLADLFNYLMMCIQAWSFRSPFTPLSSYLK